MPYVLHVRTQTCRACGTLERHSTLYLAESVPTFGRAQKLLPCTTISPTDPIHIINLPLTTTPACASCASDRSGIGAEAWARWQETLVRKAAQPRESAKQDAKTSSLESLA